MYTTDPMSVRQLRAAALIEAEQARSHRVPVPHSQRPIRRILSTWIAALRRQRPTPTPTPTPDAALVGYESHDLLVGLDRRTLTELSRSFVVMDVAAGDSLGRQGELAPEFVVVLEGRIGVSIDGLPLAVLDAGSHFGALPLLDDGPTPYQRASFNVLDQGRVAVASRLQFHDMLESFPVVARRIRTIADIRRAYLAGRADAEGASAVAMTEEFPLHVANPI